MSTQLGRWLLALILTGWFAIPGSALEGDTQDVTLDAVTCLNHTTGETAVGVVTGSVFDCSALAADEGDTIGVVLHGIASTASNREACTELQMIEEVEPNGTLRDVQELTQPGISIRGNANTDNDLDAFRLHLPEPQRLKFTLSPSLGTPLDLVFFDGVTFERLGTCGEAGSMERSCEGLFSPSLIDIVIFSGGKIGAYTLDVLPIPPGRSRIEGTSYDRSRTGGLR